MITRNGNAPEYEGLCIRTKSRANGMDSYYTDHYMVVWNPAQNKTEEVYLFCDRADKVEINYTIDATSEVLAAYLTWTAELNRKALEAEQERRAKIPARGKTLKVVRGRKVPKGTTGVCIWTGNGHWGERVGLKDAAGTVHWTAMDNVEVLMSKAA